MKKIFLTMFILGFITFLSGCNLFNNESTDASNGNGDSFYSGKTIEMLVPYKTGGGTDTFARFIQPYLSEHIEASPNVQTVNVPGGGGINGMNEFETLRDHNGQNILTSTATGHLPYVFDDPQVKFDLQTLHPIVGLPAGGVVFVSPSTGIEQPEDVLNPDEDLILAGLSATGLDAAPALAFDMLGSELQTIMGYEGRGPARVSFEQGETNVNFQTTPAYIENVQPLVDEGEAIPLFTFGQINENGEVVRDSALPEVPTIKEFYKEVHGEEPSGEKWDALKTYIGIGFTIQKVIWTHEDAPEQSVEELRAAAQELSSDEELKEAGEQALGGYEVVVGEELEKVTDEIFDLDPQVVEWIKNYLAEEFGVERLN